MDILNWLYLAKNKFVRTTLSSAKDLMIFGAKVGVSKRGDIYQNYAMSAEDFTTEVTNVVKPYKVYTALLTQNGDEETIGLSSGDLTVGVTYYIDDAGGGDFTNVGAPNNDSGTYFVATGTTPNSWGTIANILYTVGAPVVTVLENTIGNVWFTYNGAGVYSMNSSGLFTSNKTIGFAGGQAFSTATADPIFNMAQSDVNIIEIDTPSGNNGYLNGAPIEIRVYN